MTQEDKQLLLKDISARLPYNTIVSVAEGGINGIEWNKAELNLFLLYQIEEEDAWEFVKPYLRPMSSMTDEEKSQYNFYLTSIVFAYDASLLINWLNEHHFDYRGLIEKNLALDCTELHIYD